MGNRPTAGSGALSAGAADFRRLGGPVHPDAQGSRVDGYLAREFPFLSRAGWQKRIDDCRLLVNGRGTKSSARLKAGDVLSLHAPPAVEPKVDKGIAVLWEDGGVMAVFKPGNLPMHENGPYRKNTFTELVWRTIGREWSAVHRLDRETSGIVLCAATPELRGQLAEDLAARRVRKEYLAIARGAPKETAWRADGPIGDLAGSAIRIKKWVVPGGLPACTDFSVVGVGPEACLLLARPLTGRTNQIRIHAAEWGHPLYGDKLYHPNEGVFLEYFAKGATPAVVEATAFPRLCLHAAGIEFTHPGTRKTVRVESPLPPDLVELWAALAAGRPAHTAWRFAPSFEVAGPGLGGDALEVLEVDAEGHEDPIGREVAARGDAADQLP